MLKVQKIEHKLVMMQALMKIHHHKLDDKLASGVAQNGTDGAKTDATINSKQMAAED